MSQDKDREFLEQLIEATRDGRIAWEPTATLDEFTASFRGKYIVIVAKGSGDRYTLRLLDESGREMLSLEGKYEEIPGYPNLEPALDPNFLRTKELFELARRTGLHVEEAMADILGEIKR